MPPQFLRKPEHLACYLGWHADVPSLLILLTCNDSSLNFTEDNHKYLFNEEILELVDDDVKETNNGEDEAM